MSILIKGMKMPKSCINCSVKADPDNRMCLMDGHIFEETLGKLLYRRDENCPLVEIPPHGRLIDADKIPERFAEVRDLAPTIIPSEES